MSMTTPETLSLKQKPESQLGDDGHSLLSQVRWNSRHGAMAGIGQRKRKQELSA